MPLVLGGLPDAEIERLAKLPRRTKEAIFGKAEAWLKENQARLRGQGISELYILIDTETLFYARGTDHKDACKHFKKCYGRTPKTGRSFLGCQLKKPR